MKKVFFILFFLPHLCRAQDCDKIEKLENQLRGFTIYHSPYRKPIIASREFRDGGADSLILSFIVEQATHLDATNKGLFIKFSDGTYYRLPEKELFVIFGIVTATQARLYIDKELFELFTKKHITQFGVGGFTKNISEKLGDAIPGYLICLAASK